MRRQLVGGGGEQGGDVPQFDDAVMSRGAQTAGGLIQVHLHHAVFHVVEGGQGFSPAIRNTSLQYCGHHFFELFDSEK